MTPQEQELAETQPEAFALGVEVERDRSGPIIELAEAAGASPARAIGQGWTVSTSVTFYRAQAVANGRARDYEAKVAELGLAGGKKGTAQGVAAAARHASNGDLGDQVVALLEEQRGGPIARAANTRRVPAAAASGGGDLGDQVVDMINGRLMA